MSLVESESVHPFLSQIDSWWYYKDELQGVSNWSELPEIFPNGLDFIQESTGWPMVAHNRYWSKDNVYAEQNGGKFQFYIGEWLANSLFYPYLIGASELTSYCHLLSQAC